MDKDEVVLWGRQATTQQFLQDLAERFSPDSQWAAAEDFHKVQRLRGNKEVLEWIGNWLKG